MDAGIPAVSLLHAGIPQSRPRIRIPCEISYPEPAGNVTQPDSRSKSEEMYSSCAFVD